MSNHSTPISTPTGTVGESLAKGILGRLAREQRDVRSIIDTVVDARSMSYQGHHRGRFLRRIYSDLQRALRNDPWVDSVDFVGKKQSAQIRVTTVLLDPRTLRASVGVIFISTTEIGTHLSRLEISQHALVRAVQAGYRTPEDLFMISANLYSGALDMKNKAAKTGGELSQEFRVCLRVNGKRIGTGIFRRTEDENTDITSVCVSFIPWDTWTEQQQKKFSHEAQLFESATEGLA